MTTLERENAGNGGDLEQRVSRLEEKVLGGRSGQTRWSGNGLEGALWTVLTVAAIFWSRYLPYGTMAWLVCIAAGVVISSVARGWKHNSMGNENVVEKETV